MSAAGRRLENSREHLDGCRLAAAVWSEKTEYDAFRNLQVEILNGDEVAEFSGQSGGMNHSCWVYERPAGLVIAASANQKV